MAVEPEWLLARRKAGASQAAEIGLPTTKTPGWEFTDLSDLVEADFALPNGGDPSARKRADAVLNPPEQAPRVVQVDGTTVEGEAPQGEAPSEPVVTTLAAAAERYPELVGARLGSIAAPDDPFVARNDAAWRGGAFIYVPAGKRLPEPAQIAAVHDSDGVAIGFRTLIVLEEGAEAEVWEQWLATESDRAGLFNTVTEIVVGPGATLRYVSAQGLGERSWVFATQRAEVDRDATLDWVALGFGSARGKVRMETKLIGPGSTARVTGAYAGDGTQHLDFDTTQEHAAHATVSDLAFRGVLQRHGHGRLARDDQGRPRRPADRRFSGIKKPLDFEAGARRRDPRAGDRGRRRALHPRCRDRPDRRRPGALPARPRAVRGRGEAPGDRGFPRGAGRAAR